MPVDIKHSKATLKTMEKIAPIKLFNDYTITLKMGGCENVLGLYNVGAIEAESLVKAIIEVVCRAGLSLNQCQLSRPML